MKKRIFIGSALGIVLLIIVLLVFRACSGKEQKIAFETTKVTRGTVSNYVTATGTVEAVKTVDVGTQVSGEISKIYVDYNSRVKAGQLLAELDRRSLKSTLEIAEASLDNAKAEMDYQTAKYNRTKALFEKTLAPQSDYDEALYNYENAKAALKTAQLNYDKAKINLDYASIYSPIDGVVLTRDVDEGQTVAASYSTPTLFTIAKDLTKMQVEASVDEADIGQVQEGQRVSFTVDAFPDLKFAGEVTQIRLEPTTSSNVVTYTVIIEAPNPDTKLMPGMTASVTIFTEEAENTLIVASKVLRFKPDETMLTAYLKDKPGSVPQEINKEQGSEPANGKPSQHNTDTLNSDDHKMYEVWIKNGDNIHPVNIETGIDDDKNVQVISGLKEGEEVIVAMNSSVASGTSNTSTGNSTTSSPFMPKPPSRNRNKK